MNYAVSEESVRNYAILDTLTMKCIDVPRAVNPKAGLDFSQIRHDYAHLGNINAGNYNGNQQMARVIGLVKKRKID
jgi:hypothetical protein